LIVMYPQGRSSASKVRAFTAWVGEVFTQHPDFQDATGMDTR
jgi:hypothetical protein